MKKLKEKLNAKLSKNGGFTLVEMLVVVAIIAILVAISIPIVGKSLERAREATDAANERAFKAVLVAGQLLNDAGMGGADAVAADTIYAYDAANGKHVSQGSGTGKSGGLSGYGKGTTAGLDTTARSTQILWGKIDATGEVTMGWAAAADSIASVPTSGLTSDKFVGAS